MIDRLDRLDHKLDIIVKRQDEICKFLTTKSLHLLDDDINLQTKYDLDLPFKDILTFFDYDNTLSTNPFLHHDTVCYFSIY